MSGVAIATSLRWVRFGGRNVSLMAGRVELAQICQGRSEWFYTLRFCRAGETPSFSTETEREAKDIAEAHASRVLAP